MWPWVTAPTAKYEPNKKSKGPSEDSIVEGTTFDWIIHGGDEYVDDKCMFINEAGEYEMS